ncbi:MAG TPA: hypothetical protein VNM35_11370 [Chitinophagaceae bacterium]|jgi:hypothetical protein|nr:hypothetical protein [Chitinophagaceae bacterium]
MRKEILFVCLSLVISPLIFSQDNKMSSAKPSIGKSSFIAELGGPGIVFSANYDTRFKQSRLGVGGRIGIGFVSGWQENYDPVTGYYDSDEQTGITFPVQLNYIFGKEGSAHTFEVGGGITYVSKKMEIMNFYDDRETQLFGTFCFMYRRQPINGGFSWRIGFTPLVGKGYIQAFAGASVGYNF